MSVEVIRSGETFCYSVGNHVPWCVRVAGSRVEGRDSFTLNGTVYSEDIPGYECNVLSHGLVSLQQCVMVIKRSLVRLGLPVTEGDVRIIIASVQDLEVLTR